MDVKEFNNLEEKSAIAEFMKCCGSNFWSERMVARRPFKDLEDIMIQAEVCWSAASNGDVKEAFLHHPKIGDIESLEKKFASTSKWAGNEQKGVNTASREVLEELCLANEKYEKKFGFIFIIYATGKTAAEMLVNVKARMFNDPETELLIAKAEQHKITVLRLNKLFA